MTDIKTDLIGLTQDEIIESLDPLNTDIFGFSTYIWNFDFMMKISKKVKNINLYLL